MVNRGVVLFSTEAIPEGMNCSPQEINTKGKTTLMIPIITKNPSQGCIFSQFSILRLLKRIMVSIPSVAKDVRRATSMKGPTSCRAILIHKKEVLQIRPAARNRSQFFDDISSSLAVCLNSQVNNPSDSRKLNLSQLWKKDLLYLSGSLDYLE